jgi:hypothetical protein
MAINQSPPHTNSESQWLQVTETVEHKLATSFTGTYTYIHTASVGRIPETTFKTYLMCS